MCFLSAVELFACWKIRALLFGDFLIAKNFFLGWKLKQLYILRDEKQTQLSLVSMSKAGELFYLTYF